MNLSLPQHIEIIICALDTLNDLSTQKISFFDQSQPNRFLGVIDCANSDKQFSKILQTDLQSNLQNRIHKTLGSYEIFSNHIDFQLLSDTSDTGDTCNVFLKINPLHSAKNYLGKTTKHIIFDARNGISLDYLACLAGTISQNGILIILINSDCLTDQDSLRFAGSEIDTPNFNAHLSRSFFKFAWKFNKLTHKWIRPHYIESNNIIAGGDWAGDWAFAKKNQRLTIDQQTVLDQLIKASLSIQNDGFPEIYTLFCDRGTGKSYIARHFLSYLTHKKIVYFLTAPNQAALETYMDAIFFQKQPSYAFDNLLKILVNDPKNHDDIGNPIPLKAWLIVEECAVIPIKIIVHLSKYFARVLFISSTHDYEGSGRGLALKLREHLIISYSFVLEKIVRFNQTDLVQMWLDFLLLKTNHSACNALINIDINAVRGFDIRQLFYSQEREKKQKKQKKQISLDYLAGEHLLNWRKRINEVAAFYHLMYQSHYQSNVQDIRRLLDDPNSILTTITADSFLMRKQLIGGIWGLKEGGLSSDLSNLVFQGYRRPFGNLVVQTLCAHGYFDEWMHMRSLRISRIFIDEIYRQQGFAKAILAYCINRSSEALSCDFISVSFGLNASLLQFWLSQGFKWVHLGSSIDKSSGLHSAVMIKPLTLNADDLCLKAIRQFRHDIPTLSHAPFIEKRAKQILVRYLANINTHNTDVIHSNEKLGDEVDFQCTNELSKTFVVNEEENLERYSDLQLNDRKIINAFVFHHKPFEACFCALKRLKDVNIEDMICEIISGNSHLRKQQLYMLKALLKKIIPVSPPTSHLF